MNRNLTALCFVLLVPVNSGDAAATEPPVTYLSDEDPFLTIPPTLRRLDPAYAALWTKALRHTESDLKREAAVAIARAHSAGFIDLSATAEDLLAVLNDETQPIAVRLDAARALVAIDADQAAHALFEFCTGGNTTAAQIVEPALAAWKFTDIQEIWRQRLTSNTARPYQLRLAIDGLAKSADTNIAPLLVSLVEDERRGTGLRLQAARALAELQKEGMESNAAQLASGELASRLLAATMLTRHDSAAALQRLQQLAGDPEPAVATIAWRRLLAVDPERLSSLAAKTSQCADPTLRKLAADALFQRPGKEQIQHLVAMLNDEHSEVRNTARIHLQTLGQQSNWRTIICDESMKLFDANRPFELEQAILLLSVLDHKPAAAELVPLLTHDAPDIFITAAWGMRMLAVKDHCSAMLKVASQRSQEMPKAVQSGDYSRQVGHLFEAFQVMSFHDAEPLMRKFPPRATMFNMVVSRRCAIWSLSHLHAGTPDDPLVAECVKRLHDIEAMVPEFDDVRQMAAIAMGRMNTSATLPDLKKYYTGGSQFDRVTYACAWAIGQIENTEIPTPTQPIASVANWFLEPIPAKHK